MKCPRCDTIITEDAPVCRFCGQDLRALHHARKLSNAYYNIGLEKAKVRDLSGAILVLKKSWQSWKETATSGSTSQRLLRPSADAE